MGGKGEARAMELAPNFIHIMPPGSSLADAPPQASAMQAYAQATRKKEEQAEREREAEQAAAAASSFCGPHCPGHSHKHSEPPRSDCIVGYKPDNHSLSVNPSVKYHHAPDGPLVLLRSSLVMEFQLEAGNPDGVVVECADGVTMCIKRDCASVSSLIATLLKDPNTPSPICVNKVSASMLGRVMCYCQFQTQIKQRFCSDLGSQPPWQIVVKEFDNEFVRLPPRLLCEVACAAYYLEVPQLMNAACRAIAKLLLGKSTEEMRHTFGITDDLLPDDVFASDQCSASCPFAGSRCTVCERARQRGIANNRQSAPADERSLEDLLKFINDEDSGKGKKGKKKKQSNANANAGNNNNNAGKKKKPKQKEPEKGKEKDKAQEKNKDKQKDKEEKKKQREQEKERQKEKEKGKKGKDKGGGAAKQADESGKAAKSKNTDKAAGGGSKVASHSSNNGAPSDKQDKQDKAGANKKQPKDKKAKAGRHDDGVSRHDTNAKAEAREGAGPARKAQEEPGTDHEDDEQHTPAAKAEHDHHDEQEADEPKGGEDEEDEEEDEEEEEEEEDEFEDEVDLEVEEFARRLEAMAMESSGQKLIPVHPSLREFGKSKR